MLHIALHGAKAHTVQFSLKTAENAMDLIKYYAEVQMNLLAPSEDEQFDRVRKLYQILTERYNGDIAVAASGRLSFLLAIGFP